MEKLDQYIKLASDMKKHECDSDMKCSRTVHKVRIRD